MLQNFRISKKCNFESMFIKRREIYVAYFTGHVKNAIEAAGAAALYIVVSIFLNKHLSCYEFSRFVINSWLHTRKMLNTYSIVSHSF